MVNKKRVKVFFMILIGLLVTACGTSNSTESENVTLKNRVVDVSLHPISIAKSNYSFELRTDGEAPIKTAKSSVAIWGNFSKIGENKVILEMHDGYKNNSKLQVVVRDSSEKIVGQSRIFKFNRGVEDFDFGEIF